MKNSATGVNLYKYFMFEAQNVITRLIQQVEVKWHEYHCRNSVLFYIHIMCYSLCTVFPLADFT